VARPRPEPTGTLGRTRVNARLARWAAWGIVVLFFVLGAVGLRLQALAHRPFTDVGVPGLAVTLLFVWIWPITGAIIVTRHPRHPVGWLLCLGVTAGPIDMFTAGYAAYDLEVYAGSLPGVDLAHIWLRWGGFSLSVAAFTWLTLLFPSGRPASRRWRDLGWTANVALVVYILLQALEPGPVDPLYLPEVMSPIGVNPSLWVYLNPLRWGALGLLALCFAAALAGLIFRLRRARGDERQQLKWLLLPLALFALMVPVIILGTGLGERGNFVITLGVALGTPALIGLPIATALAIFRYRLYDVDRVVNRALVYATLTSILALAYLSSVIFLQLALRVFTGEGQPQWATVISTLAAAALFLPARQRVQRFIDRRFYRARYDAAKTLAAFGAALRHEVDLKALEDQLLQVVAETMQPSSVSLWRPED